MSSFRSFLALSGSGILKMAQKATATMLISHTNSGELAQTWTQFHAAAAETHLRDMISQMERSGDTTWEAIYRSILTQVFAGANDPVASGWSPLERVRT
jgi:hypothetical protein